MALLTLFASKVFAAQNPIISISIPLEESNDYNIEHKRNQIFIKFSNSLKSIPAPLNDKALNLIKKQELSEDMKTLTYDIAKPINISAKRQGSELMINIQSKYFIAEPEIDKSAESISLAFGEHADFYRFVFEYKNKPLYTLRQESSSVTLYFLSKVVIRTGDLDNYPNHAGLLQRKNNSGSVSFTIPSPLVKTGEYGNKIIIDVSKEKSLKLKKDDKRDGIEKRISIDQDFSGYAKDTQIIRDGSSIGLEQLPIYKPDEQISSISFSWNIPTAISVFERSEYIWIVFDHRQKLDLQEIRKQASSFTDEIVEIPHTKSSILRLTPKEGVSAGVRKEGLLWVVDLYRGKEPIQPRDAAIFTHFDANKHPFFFIPSASFGNIISFVDPEVGDVITAIPTLEVGVGINNRYNYPDLTLLKSAQGIGLVANASDLNLERGNTGVIIKGTNRGLNISSNLDSLKRHQLLAQAAKSSTAFDFTVPAQFFNRSFNDAVYQLKQDILTVPDEQKDSAKLNLAKYYISRGLGTNAMTILKQFELDPAYKESEQLQSLLGISNFLTKRYDQAINNFSFGSLSNNDEAIFWRTISSSAKEYRPENNVIIVSFISLIKDYPQALKERIAAVGAVSAIEAGDDISAQNFIDILKSSPHDDPYREAQIAFLTIKRKALQGYPRNAVRGYRAINDSPSLKYSAHSRYENAVLSQKLGIMKTGQAIEELERIRYTWGAKDFKLKVLKSLADLYIKDGDYYSAIRTLNYILPLENAAGKQETLDYMVSLFEDIYINNLGDNMPILKIIALYNDFEWLAPRSKQYNQMIQKLADRLVSVDLLPRARKLLENQLKYNQLSPAERSKVGTRLALIYLFDKSPADALTILDATESFETSDTLKAHRKIIRAKTLSELGYADEAIKLLDNDFSKNAILLKSEFYWDGQQWDKASETIKYLVDEPKDGEPLSNEQIGIILDWATSLHKAGKTTVLVRLRNKFLPHFKDSKYYSTFSILTSNLEHDKIDLNTVNQLINELTAFRNFTKIYNDSLKNSSLSDTIN